MLKRHISSVGSFLFYIYKKMSVRVLAVCFFHAMSYCLYCIFSFDIFEKFANTIELTINSNIPLYKLFQNHLFNIDLGLYWLLLWIIVVLISSLFDFISSYMSSHLYSHSEYYVRQDIMKYMYNVKLNGLKKLPGEAEAGFYTDLLSEGVREIIEKVSHDILPGLFFVIVGLIKMFIDYGHSIGFIMLGLCTTLGFIQYILFAKAAYFAKKITVESTKRMDVITESFRNITHAKMFMAQNYFLKRIHDTQIQETSSYSSYIKKSSLASMSTHIMSSICRFLIIGGMVFLGFMSYSHNYSTTIYKCATLISWIMYTLSDRMKDTIDVLQSFIQTHMSLKFFNRFDLDDNKKRSNINGYDISIQNLSFSFEDRKIIQNLSVKIPEGSLVSIVGKSGCGKSTLFLLLNKLLNAPESTIFIGGADVSKISDEEICNLSVYMDQNDGLINASIKDNILLGRDCENYEDIIDKTHLKSLIDKVGNDFIIGPSGKFLSGGEKKRVSIARALIQPKKLLFLDEVNTGIDPLTFEKISGDIFQIAKENKCTVFSINHHGEKIIKRSDIVIYINKHGTFVGTHSELLANNIDYKNNYNY